MEYDYIPSRLADNLACIVHVNPLGTYYVLVFLKESNSSHYSPHRKYKYSVVFQKWSRLEPGKQSSHSVNIHSDENCIYNYWNFSHVTSRIGQILL